MQNERDAAVTFFWIPAGGSSPSAHAALSAPERELIRTFRQGPRVESFVAGRWAAKNALAAALDGWEPAAFTIVPGVFGQPVVTDPPGNHQVSITHSKELAAAVAFPETHPMGIDVERIGAASDDIFEDQFTAAEQHFLRNGPWELDTGVGLLWTAKEALSKALRTGLTTSLLNLETTNWTWQNNRLELGYSQFVQYRAMGFILNDHAVTICYPSPTKLSFDILALQNQPLP